MSVQVLQGDCIQVMRALKDNSVDSVVTDPPYDLTSGKKGGTGEASLNLNSPAGRSRISTGGGFMGKEWDSTGVAFDPATWTEVLRILKPGGHLLAFGATRTYHRMACAIEDAGFEIRDSIHWVYATGFPKSKNLDGQWKGWGTALKPAHEPIVVARKLLAGTVAANVGEWGTGGINIDGCRVEGIKDTPASPRRAAQGPAYGDLSKDPGTGSGWDANTGRWPPNLLLAHSAECEPAGTTVVRGDNRQGGTGRRPGGFGNVGADAGDAAPNGPLYGNAITQVWDCVPGCPVREMDAQSGTHTSGKSKVKHEAYAGSSDTAFLRGFSTPDNQYDDTGGASRFFPVFRYQAKAPAKERPKVDGISHPTCKPLGLMRWLVRLVTPPGGICLDLFAGSGTTGEACLDEGFNCILIEREPDYIKLIRERLGRREPTLWDSLWE